MTDPAGDYLILKRKIEQALSDEYYRPRETRHEEICVKDALGRVAKTVGADFWPPPRPSHPRE